MSEVSSTTPNPEAPQAQVSWESLGLSPGLLKLVDEAGFKHPTPVQAETIPWVMDGKDLIASAQTGTGKTAAFVFPLIERLKGREGTYGLILSPSREIALQSKAVLDAFGLPLGVRSAALIGGVSLRQDEVALASYPQVLVATPGRLCDHIERGNVWLSYLETVVLDEADMMLDMGFADQLNRILDDTSRDRQTLLFSATMPEPVERLARKIMYEPKRISIGKRVSPSTSVEQNFIFTDEENKIRELMRIFRSEPGTIFVFTRSKDGATRLWRSLRSRGFYDAIYLHSDLRQSDRERSLAEFKEGKHRVMIATDVIGRGIHVEGVAHVVNFDLPQDTSDYVHRIGRTGRADAKGKATSLITPRDRRSLGELERLLGRTIRPEPRDPRPAPENSGEMRADSNADTPKQTSGHPPRNPDQRRRRRRPHSGGGKSGGPTRRDGSGQSSPAT